MIYEYTGQTISDPRNLRTELMNTGELNPIYTVIGDYVSVETDTLTEAQVDAVVIAAGG